MSESTPPDPPPREPPVVVEESSALEAVADDREQCLNCSAPLAGQYCWQCGQRAASRLITLRELVADLFDALLDVDSRLWQSLVPLLFRPGRLTVDYLAGRRARYVAPFRMYLITSLVFFLVAAIGSDDRDIDINLQGNIVTPADKEELKEQLDSLREELGDEEADVIAGIAGELDEKFVDESPDTCENLEFSTSIAWIDERMTPELIRDACQRVLDAGGSGFSAAMTDNLPAAMFIFLPLIAVVLKILYIGSGRYFVEHLLFLLHYHAFFFVLFTLLLVTTAATSLLSVTEWVSTVLEFAATIYVPVYLFKAMRTVYGQSGFVTSIKYVILGLSYLISLGMTFVGLAIYTALTI